MKDRSDDLEVRYRGLSILVVGLFGAAFAIGLILYLAEPTGRTAMVALRAGIVILLLSPAVRMLVVTAERVRRRDWVFVAMVTVVAVEISVVLWRAAARF